MKMNTVFNSLSNVHIELFQEDDPASIFISTKDYQILNLRYLELTDQNLGYNRITFIFINEKYYIANSLEEVVELEDGLMEVYQMVDNIFDNIASTISLYGSDIEKLEDNVFERKLKKFNLSEWFYYKKGLMKFNRNIDRLVYTLENFKQFTKKDLSKEFTDLLHSFGVQHRFVKSQLEKLDNLYSYYTSIKNDNLNKNIYVLSVISGIFLPLNLIVGFFGMNTNGLFLAKDQDGTFVVFCLLIILFIVLLIGFPVIQFLNKVFVSKLLGKYEFYSKLSKKLERISEFNVMK